MTDKTSCNESRAMCPDCDYPLRAETPTVGYGGKTFLVCHKCSKGWDIDQLIEAMIDSKEQRKLD